MAALSFPVEFQQAGAFSHRISTTAAILCPSHTDILNGTELFSSISLIISSQMILPEKSTKNEVVLIMADNSVRMSIMSHVYKTLFIVLLLPEGSD